MMSGIEEGEVWGKGGYGPLENSKFFKIMYILKLPNIYLGHPPPPRANLNILRTSPLPRKKCSRFAHAILKRSRMNFAGAGILMVRLRHLTLNLALGINQK